MDLLANDEQQQLIDAFARAAFEMFPLSGEHSRITDEEWRAVAALGWLGILTPEAQDGPGLNSVEAILLFREIGRQLVPGPLLASVLGARAAALAGDSALAASIVEGKTRVALLEQADSRGNDKSFRIIDGEDAALGLLLMPEAATLFALPANRRSVVSIDPASMLETSEQPGEAKLTVTAGTAPLFVQANLLLAAMAAGVCEATRDESANYARIREQFGRPIGAFQAVSHRCADMAARADVAWMQVVMAALTLDAGEADSAFAVDCARLVALTNAGASAQDNVQNHGGMGFTEKLPPSRFVKRAFLFDKLLGGKRAAQDRILSVPRAIVQGEMRAA